MSDQKIIDEVFHRIVDLLQQNDLTYDQVHVVLQHLQYVLAYSRTQLVKQKFQADAEALQNPKDLSIYADRT